jgi:hypothetical protein
VSQELEDGGFSKFHVTTSGQVTRVAHPFDNFIRKLRLKKQ